MGKSIEEELSSSRVIDANLNRLREGLRVVEDIYRYIYNNKKISSQLKVLRHLARLEDENFNNLLKHRDIKNDILKNTTKSESFRTDIHSVLIANFKRAQESARVLEEFCKIKSTNLKDESQKFKHIRYELYDLEKNIITT